MTNIDTLGDTIEVQSLTDVLVSPSGPQVTPSLEMTILPLDGATCADAAPGQTGEYSLPCSLPADPDGIGPGLPGRVRFEFGSYNPPVEFTGTLTDQVTGEYLDLCDDPDTTGCDPVTVQDLQAGASKLVVDGCNDEPVTCNDGNLCTTDSCDPETGCVYTPINCGDGNACTADSCDPATGCVNTPIDCDDGDACTTETCDPVDGCVYSSVDCNDDDACTTDSCDPASGCVNTPIDCDDGDACTEDGCDPETGCYNNAIDCNDDDACTTDSCDPASGCVNTPIDCDDSDVCTIDSCDPATGCEYDAVTCSDGDACTADFCDPVDGCYYGPPTDCDDGDICTVDSCDPATGECVNQLLPPDEAPEGCYGAEICRTPGFWGARAGDEKGDKDQNITFEVLNSVGGLSVCGTTIDNTDIGNSMSALEAICVSVKGDLKNQVVRQLTAASLNCVLGDCNDYHTNLVADCNDACAADDESAFNMCIEELDCFNNGGYWDGDACLYNAGMCGATDDICYTDDDCGEGDSCELFVNCHEEGLCPDWDDDGEINGSDFCFEPPGPASSPKSCNEARKNDVFVP